MHKINHLAIIVDGNGRWAKEKGLSRSMGHKAGSKNLQKLILYINKNQIAKYLSLYVFSTENFKRPKDEVNYIMDLAIKWFNKVKEDYCNENIKILFSGNINLLEPKLKDVVYVLENATKNNTGLVVNFCLGYGGRLEIVDATKKICQNVIDKKINIDDIDENLFSLFLYQKLPDVDYLIRTSGENRLSNFMLWQISYSEFYFPKTYFPDFNIIELNKAIKEYERRNRRFGNVK